MIILDVAQGEPEWFAARSGIPTASNFDKIISSTGKPSTQAKVYMHKLLAEWMTGIPTNNEQTEWMLRGIEMEDEARSLYCFVNDAVVATVGLAYKDDRKLISCSPDGLIGEDAGLEIKCPAPHTHVEYLLADKIPAKYIPQVQGSMYVTGRDHWDFMSYHPGMPPLIKRIDRDEKFISTLDSLLAEFIHTMLEKREKLNKIKEAA